MRYWRETAVLPPILLVAFALRLTTFKYPYLMAYDPFHHYKIAEYIVENEESLKPEKEHSTDFYRRLAKIIA